MRLRRITFAIIFGLLGLQLAPKQAFAQASFSDIVCEIQTDKNDMALNQGPENQIINVTLNLTNQSDEAFEDLYGVGIELGSQSNTDDNISSAISVYLDPSSSDYSEDTTQDQNIVLSNFAPHETKTVIYRLTQTADVDPTINAEGQTISFHPFTLNVKAKTSNADETIIASAPLSAASTQTAVGDTAILPTDTTTIIETDLVDDTSTDTDIMPIAETDTAIPVNETTSDDAYDPTRIDDDMTISSSGTISSEEIGAAISQGITNMILMLVFWAAIFYGIIIAICLLVRHHRRKKAGLLGTAE